MAEVVEGQPFIYIPEGNLSVADVTGLMQGVVEQLQANNQDARSFGMGYSMGQRATLGVLEADQEVNPAQLMFDYFAQAESGRSVAGEAASYFALGFLLSSMKTKSERGKQ